MSMRMSTNEQIYSDDDDDESEESKTTQQRAYELNLNPDYWVKNFLYPFALDPAPLRLDASKQSPEEMIAEKKR